MLIRISLIVAILAGLGALLVSHLQVGPKIEDLKTTLQNTQTELKTTQDERTKARKEAKTAKETLANTAKELADTQATLKETAAKATTQEARANRSETDLRKTRTDLTEAERSLAAWKALGRGVDQIASDLQALANATAANEALNEEKRVMIRKINNLQQRLAQYESDKDVPPDLPPGLKGKVVAVDPKWDFVILNIGSNQGLVPRGELLVDRGGKLVAKVRVTSVEANQSIANVMPEWRQAEVLAGDEVLH